MDLHRAARRGTLPPTGGGASPEDTEAAVGPDDERQAAAAGSARDPSAEVCGVCPICIAARVVGETRPELVSHLVEAGRHLGAALRSLLEPNAGQRGPSRASDHPSGDPSARPSGSPGEDPGGERAAGLRRIDLDRPRS